MKERLVVMNGQRVVQTSWGTPDEKNDMVGKANGVKPGVYNLHSASEADKKKSHEGQIVHSDKGAIYQKAGSYLVKHKPSDFDILPFAGSTVKISYSERGRAVTEAASQQQSRGLSR
ncbi:hypothetical protein IQ22_04696 [Pseudomonas duriflava]|uniref:KfrB domain-containing protein n=1 Tax=Pseudomonas duriflava TaxID=459528 RepID=A0A562PJQ2_9PSED|nr:KfrB domain-containing protein [Pseudomonas duriflava]TWI44681.1 hypothetical protein IQ22_04696 [Pseudomonas duriflava]